MKTYSDALRWYYPELTPDSIVVDCGGYEGNWFAPIAKKYNPWIVVFEPHWDYYYQCCEVAKMLPKVAVKRAAIAINNGAMDIAIKGDMTGRFVSPNLSNPPEAVWTHSASGLVTSLGWVHVLKLNIEGMEYEVLESLIESRGIRSIGNIQVQFHFNFPDAKERYEKLRARLLETHEPEWDSEPLWQNWRLR